jgi:two-component system, cell cycle response regulator
VAANAETFASLPPGMIAVRVNPPTLGKAGMTMDSIFQDVLVVDDDRVIRTILSDMLEPAGFKVRQATNGTEALQILRQDCPYLVITDWLMSPINGIEFCRRLRREKLSHYVFVVLLTAKSQADDIITGLNAGADDFLTKPVRQGELFARLQTGLRILELEHRLSELARRDPLTGVLNRRTFYEVFEREWSRAIRYHHPLSCVMVDVDFFKKINDTYGHLVGDHVLKFLAQSLEGQSRCPDYICRWGGEEFCILLPETDEQGACIWAERCCSAIAEAEFCSGQHNVTMTASFGVAQLQEEMQSPEQLLGRADQALFAAKRAGRHRVVSFGSIAHQESVLVGSNG